MAKTPTPTPQRPANLEARRGSLASLPGKGSRARLPLGAFTDPVEDWKRDALATVGAANPGAPRVTLRVQLGFSLVVLIAGAPFGVIGWAVALATFLAVSFVQELPSVLAARAAKRSVCWVLSASGGHLEIDGPPCGRFKLAVLSVCGALGNLVVALGLALLLRRGLVASGAASILWAAALVHGLCGVGQLLPLAPFRAGREIARRLRPPLRFAFAAVSLVAMGVAGLWVLRAPELPAYFLVFVLAMMASTSALRDAFNDLRDDQAGVAVLTAIAAKLLRQEQPMRAAEVARQALANATVEGNRVPIWQTLAWAGIANRDPFTAHGALLSLPAGLRDLHLVTAYLACCGRSDEAIALLQEARAHGHRAPETSKLLIDLLFQAGLLAEAAVVARADRLLLDPDSVCAIEAAFAEAGAPARA